MKQESIGNVSGQGETVASIVTNPAPIRNANWNASTMRSETAATKHVTHACLRDVSEHHTESCLKCVGARSAGTLTQGSCGGASRW